MLHKKDELIDLRLVGIRHDDRSRREFADFAVLSVKTDTVNPHAALREKSAQYRSGQGTSSGVSPMDAPLRAHLTLPVHILSASRTSIPELAELDNLPVRVYCSWERSNGVISLGLDANRDVIIDRAAVSLSKERLVAVLFRLLGEDSQVFAHTDGLEAFSISRKPDGFHIQAYLPKGESVVEEAFRVDRLGRLIGAANWIDKPKLTQIIVNSAKRVPREEFRYDHR